MGIMLLINDTLYSQYPCRWTGGADVYSNSRVAFYQVEKWANRRANDMGPVPTSSMAFFTMAMSSLMTNTATNWTAQVTSNICTVDTIIDHQLIVNQRITIAGATFWANPGRLGAGINATFNVTSVPTTHTFTFAYTLGDAGPFTETAAAATITPSTMPNVTGWPVGSFGIYALIQPQASGGIAVTGRRILGSSTLTGVIIPGINFIPTTITIIPSVTAAIYGKAEMPIGSVPISASATVTTAATGLGIIVANPSGLVTVTGDATGNGAASSNVIANATLTALLNALAEAVTNITADATATGNIKGVSYGSSSISASAVITALLIGIGNSSANIGAPVVLTVDIAGGLYADSTINITTTVTADAGGLIGAVTNITAPATVVANILGKGVCITNITSSAVVLAAIKGVLGAVTNMSGSVIVTANINGIGVATSNITDITTITAVLEALGIIATNISASAVVTASGALGSYAESNINGSASISASINAEGNLQISIIIPGQPTALDNAAAVWAYPLGDKTKTADEVVIKTGKNASLIPASL
jgi:hypothetical protein